MKNELSGTQSISEENIAYNSRGHKPLALCVLIVGVHSLALGTFIFFYTEIFYGFFFGTDVENVFFVKQAGLFLICLGLFYLAPLVALQGRSLLVSIIVVTKVLAVLFLLMHAQETPRPIIIMLAAFVDTSMAILLTCFVLRERDTR